MILQSSQQKNAAAASAVEERDKGKGKGRKRNENRLTELFQRPKEMPDMAPGLLFFIRRHLSRSSDLAATKAERATVRWGCKVIEKVLASVALGSSLSSNAM